MKDTLPWIALVTGIVLLPRLFFVRYPQRKPKVKPTFIKLLDRDDQIVDIGSLLLQTAGQHKKSDEVQNF